MMLVDPPRLAFVGLGRILALGLGGAFLGFLLLFGRLDLRRASGTATRRLFLSGIVVGNGRRRLGGTLIGSAGLFDTRSLHRSTQHGRTTGSLTHDRLFFGSNGFRGFGLFGCNALGGVGSRGGGSLLIGASIGCGLVGRRLRRASTTRVHGGCGTLRRCSLVGFDRTLRGIGLRLERLGRYGSSRSGFGGIGGRFAGRRPLRRTGGLGLGFRLGCGIGILGGAARTATRRGLRGRFARCGEFAGSVCSAGAGIGLRLDGILTRTARAPFRRRERGCRSRLLEQRSLLHGRGLRRCYFVGDDALATFSQSLRNDSRPRSVRGC